MMDERFTEEVCQKIGNYVYRLIDPRNGETFYVGKGRNNRVFEHAAGALKSSDVENPVLDAKLSRIREIQRAHLRVIHVIHRHEIPDHAIFEVEAALIDAYPGLTNIQGGHGSTDRGPANHHELSIKYNLPVFPENPEHSLLLINIAKLEDRDDPDAVYKLVRFAWRLKKERAENAEFVIAVCRGVAVGAFKATAWFPAVRQHFSDIPYADGSESDRFGFSGVPASPAIRDLYVGQFGKRITQTELKHVQNPIRYWKC